MNEQTLPGIGTVAEEAARLIEGMASMARASSGKSEDPGSYAGPGPYAGGRTEDSAGPGAPQAAQPRGGPEVDDPPPPGACSGCSCEHDDTPAACRICPLCRGIALLRSVRPETVDMLADLAASVAASLRDVATQTRASDPASSARSGRSASGSPSDGDRGTVHDIPVDDESEG